MTKLRPRDISVLSADTTDGQIAVLLASSYDNFCTCVVAEAARRAVPAALRRALRQPEWRDDWVDALTGAEARLQVAVLRARYEDGPQSERARSNSEALTAVRTRLHEVRADTKRQHRGRTPAVAEVDDRVVRAATKKLIAAHVDQYELLVDAAMAAAGVHPDIRRGDSTTCATLTRWALTVGGPVPEVTDRVQQLDALPDAALDQVTARDVQGEPEEPDLTHPLLLDRWGESLGRLAGATADRLGLPHRPMAAVSDVDLTVAGLDQEAAYRRINQFRFLAHVQQRWLEQKTLVRRFRRQVAEWQYATVRPPQDTARAELRRAHPDEYGRLVQQAESEQAAAAARRMPNPRAASGDKPTAPQAAQVLADKLTEAGWHAEVEFEPPTSTSRARARVTATRAGAMARAAYKRKNNGRGGGQGWQLMFAGVRVRGGDWVELAKLSDLVDLGMLPEAEFAGQVTAYRAAQHSPTVPRG